MDTSASSDVIFTTLEYTDHARHTIGYGDHVEEYLEASKQEDWLIIITTEHGGQSDEEKTRGLQLIRMFQNILKSRNERIRSSLII